MVLASAACFAAAVDVAAGDVAAGVLDAVPVFLPRMGRP